MDKLDQLTESEFETLKENFLIVRGGILMGALKELSGDKESPVYIGVKECLETHSERMMMKRAIPKITELVRQQSIAAVKDSGIQYNGVEYEDLLKELKISK